MSVPSKWLRLIGVLSVGVAFVSCSGGTGPGESSTGSVGMALAFPPADLDVVAVLFEVTNDAGETQSQIVPLEPQPLPDTVDPDLAGHPFADWFVVLNPGEYDVVATPLASVDPIEPSSDCEPVLGTAVVQAGLTTEIVLVSNCTGEDSGALDVVVVLNRAPFIEELEFDPSKFVCDDDETVIVATASDPDGDELTYDWQVTALPPGADASSFTLTSMGPVATFSATVPGVYELTVTVSDGQASTQLVFPVYVLECDDECQNDDECDNGQFCDGAEVCVGGVCQAGTPPDVDDGVDCTDDSCDEDADMIVNAPNDANCDNGQFCDGGEACDPVDDCQPGLAPDPDDGVDCTDDRCDEATGSIVNTPNDANCDDEEICDVATGCVEL